MTAITELAAGRELDALVLEKVIKVGSVVHDTPWGFPVRYPPDIPHYSTDIAAAWEVVEKLRDWEPEILVMDKVCRVTMHFNDAEDFCVFAPTAPEAICRAALIMVNA